MKVRVAMDGITRERKWPFSILTVLWVVGSFIAASAITVGLEYLLTGFDGKGKNLLAGVDRNVLVTAASVVVYALLILIVLGVPRLLKLWSGKIDYRRLLGLTRLLQWRDIGFAIVGFVIYLALGVVVSLLVQHLVPGYNSTQAQDTGFSKVLSPSNALFVFLTLVVIAPVSEEIIFRGYLFGTLRRSVPVWVAIIVTSLVFGLVHMQWNVGIDVFVMSLVSCVLRLRSGSLWASILLHMMKNGLAFYVLYIAGSPFM